MGRVLAVLAVCLFLTVKGHASNPSQPKPIATLDLSPIVKVDLTSASRSVTGHSSVVFLTDRLLLISNSEASPRLVLYDVEDRRVLRTGAICGSTAPNVYGTFTGKVLATCNGGFELYDQEFGLTSHFSAPLGSYDLLLSPTRQFVALNPLPRQGVAKVLATGTLAEVATFPSDSRYVIDLFGEGYIVYESAKGKQGWELLFYRFGDSRPQSIAKNNKNCAQVGFGISESEFLKLACGKEGGEIIDLSTGKVKTTILGAESGDFAISARSRKRFALAWMDHSRAHAVRQYLNPFTYIAALGTCCEFASTPLMVTVRLLPSADTTMRPLLMTLRPFVTLNPKMWSSTTVYERKSEFGSPVTG
jgi:hypothetical protein